VIRVFGSISLLVVLVTVGYLMTRQTQSSDSDSPPMQQAVAAAQSAAAVTNFSQADSSMQAFFVQNQTYVGAVLPAGSGVALVDAAATSFCLQAAGEHQDGPGGTVQPGAC
jgi:hypothetical protein